MPNWKKLITSGSSGSLANLEVDNHISASLFSGSFYGDGSNLTGITFDTSSLLTTASAEFSELTFTKGDGSTFPVITTPRKLIETVKNGESFTLAKGTPVYVSGSQGNASIVYAASSSLSSKMPAAYVLNEELIADAEGEAILAGFINGVNTSTFNEGDSVYVGENGGYTNIKPTGSNLIQKLGNVINSAVNGSGVITGAGRSNDVPNITPGYVWLGNSGSVATPVSSASLFVDTASFALSASFTSTASLAIQAISIFPYTSSINNIAIISGSLVITGSAAATGSLETTGSVEFSYDKLSGAWSTGGPLSQGRHSLAGAGTQNAALAFGGSPYSSCTEEYNGTSWSAGGTFSLGRDKLAGAGTQNAALAFGGYLYGTCTLEYDGSTWTAGGTFPQTRQFLGGAGTQNAGLAFGGYYTAPLTNTEEYNGASWSAGGALSLGAYKLAGAGTQNAGLAFGGVDAAYNELSCTQEYNGLSWASGGNLNVARSALAGAGTQNEGLAFGGYDPNCTEEYNGTTWEAGGALITGRNCLAGAGAQESALAFGGYGGYACTEEYSLSPVNITTFDYNESTGNTCITDLTGDTISFGNLKLSSSDSTVAFNTSIGANSWVNTTPMSICRNQFASITPSNTSNPLAVGGGTTFLNGESKTYDDSVEIFYPDTEVWAYDSNLNIGRKAHAGGGNLIIGGFNNDVSTNVSASVEHYNGTWTNCSPITTGRLYLAASGCSNCAIVFGGSLGPGGGTTCTEEYTNGTPSAGGSLNFSRVNHAGAGTQNAALAFGGYLSSAPYYMGCTEQYDASTNTWSNCANMNVGRICHTGGGTQNAALAFGGCTTNATEEFNGATNTWTTLNNLNCQRLTSAGGRGNNNNAFVFGGEDSFAGFTAETYCDLNYTRSHFDWNSTDSATLLGCFTGEFKGTLNGTSRYSHESTTSVSSSFATTASYVEADSINYSGLTHYNDDTAAAAGGVPIGGLYRNGNFLVIRLT
jgi:hypothetical protein